jgi:MoaA/NifB/PqqE/SkfB family radical SAM enzyme
MIDIIKTIDLDHWYTLEFFKRESWLKNQLLNVYQTEYKNNQRIVFVLANGDEWTSSTGAAGIILETLQKLLNQIDISNYFVIVRTDPVSASDTVQKYLQSISTDPVSLTVEFIMKKSLTEYSSSTPIKISLDSLTQNHRHLLTESKTFCMYPWVHLHAYPTGEAWPCCQSEMKSGGVGNTRIDSLKTIWNSDKMKRLRVNMLNNQPNPLCTRCYEQEDSGFFSGRQSANKHHGHHVDRVNETQDDGTLDRFEMTHWDIRFSNLCNLKCRSCGHIFSSQWYQDQARLAGPEWKARNTVLNYAGRTETDIWEQLLPHLDHVEQIYFAGGEPLLMEEHYRILDELVKRKRFDVRLIYNTNFTHTDLKGQSVFDYWKQFDSVSVGASLDDMGVRAEYIRKGTDWTVVEQNRRLMLATCPKVDFYISPTLSIMNACHLPDFHKSWVEQGLIRAQDLNVNILQDPEHYRIDIATAEYKQQLTQQYQSHIAWLKDQGDSLGRAIQGFESAITFMNATDNTHLIDTFWRKSHELDAMRKENILDVIPELIALK